MNKQYTPDQLAKMKQLGIPVGADVAFIDMGKGTGEKKTAGWTDSQIKGKSLEDIDKLIQQAQKAADGLRQALEEQEKRVLDLRMIRARRLELGT